MISQNSLPPNCQINPEGFQGTLRDISSNIDVLGSVKLNLEITPNLTINHECLVIQNSLPSNMILGADILARLQAVIDFQNKKNFGSY